MHTRFQQRLVILMGVGVLALAFAAGAHAALLPETGPALHLQSEPGDPIGRGQELLYTADNASFNMWYVNGYLTARVEGRDGNFSMVHMEAPDGENLVVGTTYRNLTLWPFNGGSGYGLSVSSFGASCSWLGTASEMTITELEVRPVFPNEIERLDVSFVQYCNDSSAPLRGRVVFHAPPDTTPPVLYGVEDRVVEAPNADGANVYYGPYAIDDRDGFLTVDCSHASGSLFPIGTTRVTCTAVDRAGNQAEATFVVAVDPPFELGLAIAASGNASTSTGVATARGVVTCNRAATVYVNATITQVVARRATIQGSAQIAVPCVKPSTTWSADVSSPNGALLPGKATVEVTAFTCPFYCHGASSSRAVTLRGI